MLVVTGSPGVGKSAVLGRVVTTADVAMRAVLPGDDAAPRAEVGSVACAVHAKGKTALDVAMEIARAASAPIPERVDDLVGGLRSVLAERAGAVQPDGGRAGRGERPGPGPRDRHEAGRADRRDVRGCGRAGGGRHPPRATTPARWSRHSAPRPISIDLDEPRYFALDDLVSYAMATLQLRGAERAGNPYQAGAVAEPVARRIAEIAEPNFLVAALVARTHGLYDEQPVAVSDIAFTADVATVLGAFLDRLAAVGGLSSREALTALAAAEAPGFTPELWQQAVTALYAVDVSPVQLRHLAVGSAANFLVESSGTVAAYRLFHQALSDALWATRGRNVDPTADEAALTRAMLSFGSRAGWGQAPDYLFRSLPGHAVRAGMVDALLADVEYVLHADLHRLVPAADQTRTGPGAATAQLLRRTPRALHAEPGERLALLTLTEALDTTRTTFRDHTPQIEPPYRGRWASVLRRTERAVLEGHTGWVRSVCAVRVGGRELLASAGDDQTVRVWDPATGGTERVLEGHTGWVNAVAWSGWVAGSCWPRPPTTRRCGCGTR